MNLQINITNIPDEYKESITEIGFFVLQNHPLMVGVPEVIDIDASKYIMRPARWDRIGKIVCHALTVYFSQEIEKLEK